VLFQKRLDLFTSLTGATWTMGVLVLCIGRLAGAVTDTCQKYDR
jgi:hypothetical protein